MRALAPGETEVRVNAGGEVTSSVDGRPVYSWGGAGSDPLPIVVADAGEGVTPVTGPDPGAQTPFSADFVTPDPAECTITPRTADELVVLAETPDQAAVDALEAAWFDPPLTVPDGAPADAAKTTAVVETYRLIVACFNAGNKLAVDALWTDDALRQFEARVPTGEPTPVPADMRAAFRVTEVRVLPDGRMPRSGSNAIR